MKKHLVAGVGVLLLVGSSVEAQTLGIEHQPVGCAVAEKFPRLEARFAPAASVATARVLFQGQNPEWYSVAMKPEGAVFVGILPKPKKSLKAFRYYIEVTDQALGTNRTADFTASVVDNSSSCQGKMMAGALASASVVLQGPAGVAALPAGFASSGVVAGSAAGSSAGASAGAAGAAGGGISTAVLVAGGVAVAGGAAAVAAKSAGAGGGQQDRGVTIEVTPRQVRVPNGGSVQFTAVAKNESGKPISPQPRFSWSSGCPCIRVTENGLATLSSSFGPGTCGSVFATAEPGGSAIGALGLEGVSGAACGP